MLGVISNLVVVALVAMVAVIVVNSGIIAYLVRLLDFSDKQYITGLIIACILGALNVVISLLAMFVRIWPIVVEVIGMLIFFGAVYKLAEWKFKQTKKELLAFSLLMSLFAFALNYVTVFIITFFINSLTIA